MNVSNDEEMWRYVDLEICWIQRFKVFMNGTMMMRFGDVWIKGGFLSSLGVRRQKVVQILKPLLWNRFYWEEDQRNKSFLIRDENIIANSVNRIQTLSSHFHPPVVLKRDILHFLQYIIHTNKIFSESFWHYWSTDHSPITLPNFPDGFFRILSHPIQPNPLIAPRCCLVFHLITAKEDFSTTLTLSLSLSLSLSACLTLSKV